MNLIPYIAIGGALGSCLRFMLAGWIARLAGAGFPWGILSINVVGSLLMGLLVGWMAKSGAESRGTLHALLAVGFLGGFTTFSSFAAGCGDAGAARAERNGAGLCRGFGIAGGACAWRRNGHDAGNLKDFA